MANFNKVMVRLFSSFSFIVSLYCVFCYQSPHRTIAASIRDMTNILIPYKSPVISTPLIAFEDVPSYNKVDGYDGRYSNNSTDNTTDIEKIQRIFYLAKRLKQLQDPLMPLEQRETLAKEVLDEDALTKRRVRHHMVANIRNGGLFGGLFEDDEWNTL